MNTGTYKGFLFGLTAILLSACEDTATLDLKQQSGDKPATPITQAQMMRGKVVLVAPKGYCIAPQSLTQRFALMARCDKLGGKKKPSSVPAAVLSASLARRAGTPITTERFVHDSDMKVVKNLDVEGVDVVRVTRENAPATLSKTHLRGIAQLGKYTLSLALFSKAKSAAQGSRGALIMQKTVQASQKASAKIDVKKTTAN